MTRVVLTACVALFAAAGCKNVAGPREARSKPKPDQPAYSIDEQQYRGRDKYAIPEDDWRVAPDGLIGRPSPTGR
jgi:hypothetical protein